MSNIEMPVRGVRRNGVADRILTAAVREVMRYGAAKVSMADVAEAAQVSRTTLYKYFPVKDDLLAALGLHVRELFHRELDAALKGRDAPRDRLVAVLDFMRRFHEDWRAEQMVDLEIGPIVQGIRLSFDYYCSVMMEALAPTFDALDALFGQEKKVRRRLLVDVLIRVQLSNAIVRLDREWDELPGCLGTAWDMMHALAHSTMDQSTLDRAAAPATRRKRS